MNRSKRSSRPGNWLARHAILRRPIAFVRSWRTKASFSRTARMESFAGSASSSAQIRGGTMKALIEALVFGLLATPAFAQDPPPAPGLQNAPEIPFDSVPFLKLTVDRNLGE